MKKPYWWFTLYDMTLVPLSKRALRGFGNRAPLAAVCLTLLFTPFVSMLYLGRWKRAVFYILLTFAAIMYGRVMVQLNPHFLDMEFSLLDIAIRIIASFDAYTLAKRQEGKLPWYSRWYSIIVLCFTIVCSTFLTFFALQLFFITILHVPTNSMAPTIVRGDYILVWKTKEHFDYGDIMVHAYPGKPHVLYARRVIGKPGDKVKSLQAHLYINDEPVIRVLSEDKIYREIMPNGVAYDTLDLDKPYTRLDSFPNYHVPAENYFTVGDNRDRSDDSRSAAVGFIPKNAIFGKVVYICKAPCKLFGGK